MVGNFRLGKLYGEEAQVVTAYVAPHQMPCFLRSALFHGCRRPTKKAGTSVKLFCFSFSCLHLPEAGMGAGRVWLSPRESDLR